LNQRTVSEESKTSTRAPARASDESLRLFASAPRDLVTLLRRELVALGATHLRAGHAGVRFRGSLEVAYRACLWSRLASRILLPLASFEAPTREALYEGVRDLPWREHVPVDGTLSVDFVGSRSKLTHTRYGAQNVKDAVVDQLREQTGRRPSVDRVQPDVRINAHLDRDVATIAIDLAGTSLHRRGYRRQSGPAPLKENVAAAMLTHARWPEMAAAGEPLLDPMCGSATLPIEAALMAADAAPGLGRDYFGLQGWGGHDAALWERLRDEARQRRREGLERLPPIAGFDIDARAVAGARDNLLAAGLADHVAIARGELAELRSPWPQRTGLLVCNPPYGKRLGDEDAIAELFATMGEVLASGFGGWHLVVLSGSPHLASRLGLRPRRSHKLDNGPLACRLTHFEIPAGDGGRRARREHTHGDPNAAMFANRLRKNLRSIGRWARRENIDCYRLYDADMPEYAFAVDVYAGADTWIVAQEYQAPASIPPAQSALRRTTVLDTVAALLEVPAERVVLKTRRRQEDGSQYPRLAVDGALHEVRENGCRLLVNFSDRLDTGLFLDHRRIRRMVRDLAPGRRFLNLFAYTGAATVYAAGGGATATTSVDLSGKYLDWARRNLALNGFAGPEHVQVRADCLDWLQTAPDDDQRYGVVLLDMPTFSNSKRMAGTVDVQRDHATLISLAARRLAPDGVLLFSNHLKRFHMDRDPLTDAGLALEDITRETIPRDFARNPRAHHCWRIRHRRDT
jgi:23S rRNA (guanine2445-N2)-methyltransferase / 23S rRNA (guanine2069-N7)-methyltransferase